MPTLKAIHICNPHQQTHHQKLQKSMSLPTLETGRKRSTKTQQRLYAMRAEVLNLKELNINKHHGKLKVKCILIPHCA
jgi:hypothetical protein